MIEFEKVRKSFNGLYVLDGLSFCIKKGETVGLLGRSGVGKTTILRMISGLTAPDSGTVRVNTSRIGYIFQEHRCIPWKTALENICFALKAIGYADEKAREVGREYLEKTGLTSFENYYPNQLSGGMCQRVSISRAFAINPDLLLLDEPFNALDPDLKETMLGLIREMLVQRPTTVLYVSHNPEEVAKIAHRIYMLSEGGSIEEISLDRSDAKGSRSSNTSPDWSSWYKSPQGSQEQRAIKV